MTRKKEVKPMPATESPPMGIRVPLDRDLHIQLRIEAATQNRSMAALVRELVTEYLAKRPKRSK